MFEKVCTQSWCGGSFLWNWDIMDWGAGTGRDGANKE
jgi:hypothetical protein